MTFETELIKIQQIISGTDKKNPGLKILFIELVRWFKGITKDHIKEEHLLNEIEAKLVGFMNDLTQFSMDVTKRPLKTRDDSNALFKECVQFRDNFLKIEKMMKYNLTALLSMEETGYFESECKKIKDKLSSLQKGDSLMGVANHIDNEMLESSSKNKAKDYDAPQYREDHWYH